MKAFEQAWLLLKTIQGDAPDISNLRPWLPSRRLEWEEKDAGRKNSGQQTILPIDGQNKKIKKPPLPKPIPSHIEWNPHLMQGSYNLRGEDGELLSQIMPGGHFSPSDKRPEELAGISAYTPAAYRRQDYYDKLMRGLINAGVDILSDERNENSQPFHEEFQRRMTPNMEIEYQDERDGAYDQGLYYSRKRNFPTFGDSDLAQRDYGAMPIYTAFKPEDKRPANPFGSMQTSLPIFDDNNNSVTARNHRYPIVPVDSILPEDY